MFEIKGKYTTAKVMIDYIDEETMTQIYNMINNPCFTNPVSIMPDTHAGKGSCIGFTMEMNDRVIPNVVSVDIGCGMIMFYLGKNIFDLKKRELYDYLIRKEIPFGTNMHQKPVFNVNDKKFWKNVNEEIREFVMKFNKRYSTNYDVVEYSKEYFMLKCKKIGCNYERAINSLGTLGGGNHFIEIGKNSKNEYFATVHSGSRNFGLCIAKYHQNIAVNNYKKYLKNEYRTKVDKILKSEDKSTINSKLSSMKNNENITSNGLEYLEGKDMFDYLVDMVFAQAYANENRRIMAKIIADIFCVEITRSIQSIHNYISFDDFIIRKGAISSYVGRKEIIPFNMEDGLLVCEGKSNPEWNFSAPHGAGRVASRSWAKKNLSLSDAVDSMKNKDIFTSVVPLDEVKSAYKDSKIIEENIHPTATIIDRVKPVLNMKTK